MKTLTKKLLDIKRSIETNALAFDETNEFDFELLELWSIQLTDLLEQHKKEKAKIKEIEDDINVEQTKKELANDILKLLVDILGE